MADIRISKEDLSDIVSAAVKATLSADAERRASEKTPERWAELPDDTKFTEMMRERRGENVPAAGVEAVPAKSHRTGSTFTAIVSKGRVVTLEDYVFPDGIHVCQADGGLAPDGLPIKEEKSDQFTMLHKHWMWTEFRQRDLNDFVGRPLPTHAVREVAPVT